MRNVPWTRWGMAALVAMCVLSNAACGGTDESRATPTTSDVRSSTPPFELATVAAGGGRGSDLVVVQFESNRAAVRFADGTWTEIPGIEATGSWLYRSIGSTVIAGGFRCESLSEDGACPEGEPSFFMLEDDLSGWRELDAPPATVPLSDEIELTALPATTGWAMFSVGADTYLVDDAGAVSRFEAGHGLCAVDGTLVRPVIVPRPADGSEVDIATLHSSGVETRIGGFELVSLADPSAAPTTVPITDPVSTTADEVCGGGRVSIVADDGSTEWVLDVADRTVTRIESNSNEARVAGGLQIDGGSATSPEGSTVHVSNRADGRTWRRTGLEPWQDTGLELHGVYATDTAVLGLDAAANQVVELPAR
ncbi:MAG: hypothetical protein ACK4V6_03775 [Microthrixaceae bacterium]